MFFQFFGFKLILVTPIHILHFVNLYSFLNSGRPNAFNSKNCEQIKIVDIFNLLNSNCLDSLRSKNTKIDNFLNSNCPDTPNSKNIKLSPYYYSKNI